MFCAEHSISPDGTPVDPSLLTPDANVVFNEGPSGKYTPRAVMIDAEPSAMEEIRENNTIVGRLFNESVLGKMDSAGNFAKGFYVNSKEIGEKAMEAIRRQIE